MATLQLKCLCCRLAWLLVHAMRLYCGTYEIPRTEMYDGAKCHSDKNDMRL